jgi:CHAT domain-containing protein
VLDEIDLVFLTNTKDLLFNTHEGTRYTAKLYGRPSYATAVQETKVPHDSSGLNRDTNLIQQEFSDLPGTEKEIENIADVLTSYNCKADIFKYESASEENLKAIHSTDVLHIATHGFFMADDGQHVNSMIRSGIVLSSVKNNSDLFSEDGILTAYEATNLSLDSSQLVVLSACETGLGEIKNGEGVYGLQRGLKVAGARNILMSLWKVDDEATAELMIGFYKAWLSGTEIHAAFREAQVNLRKKFPSPFYWGSFILSGN